MARELRRCDGTCDTCGEMCATGTIDEYIAQQCAKDPAWAAEFAEAQREIEEWIASYRAYRAKKAGGGDVS